MAIAPPSGDPQTELSESELHLLVNDEDSYPVYEVENQYQNKKYAFEQLDLTDGQTTTDDVVLEYFYDSTKTESIGQLFEVEKSIAENDYSSAEPANSIISTHNQIEENQKQFNSIHLFSLLDSTYTYTEDDKNQLLSIANQCPLEGGGAVWQARVLWNTINNDWIEFDDNCDATKIMTAKTDKAQDLQLFNIFPNPSSGTMQITYKLLNVGDNASIQLYDLMGNFLMMHPLDSHKQLLNLDISDVSSGLYLLEIHVNSRVQQVNKIVIIK
jgi:hypothetical protein